MNLRNIDLNLLVVLDALLSERSVSRAGDRIGLTQPAMSAALGRLRQMLDDPLLIRVGRGLELTRRAEALVLPLQETLAAIEHTLTQNRGFDPSRDAMTFSIAASDYVVLVLISPFVRALSAEAPNVTVHLLPRSRAAKDLLTTNRADLVIEPEGLFGEGDFPSQRLYTDRWLCAVDAASPYAAEQKISKRQFLDSPHAIYGLGADRQPSLADRHLTKLGIERRIEVTVESFLLVPFLIQGTRLVTLVLERGAKLLSGRAAISTIEPPYRLPDIQEAMYWHNRNNADPGHLWLRERLLAIAAELKP